MNRPFTVNNVGRPVFVKHCYAGEAFIPVTNKKLIKLDECDVSTEISLKSAQPQGMECEFREHSQNLWIIQQMGKAEREQVPRHGNAAIHSDLQEDSQNSLRVTSVSQNTEALQKKSNANRGIHSIQNQGCRRQTRFIHDTFHLQDMKTFVKNCKHTQC